MQSIRHDKNLVKGALHNYFVFQVLVVSTPYAYSFHRTSII